MDDRSSVGLRDGAVIRRMQLASRNKAAPRRLIGCRQIPGRQMQKGSQVNPLRIATAGPSRPPAL